MPITVAPLFTVKVTVPPSIGDPEEVTVAWRITVWSWEDWLADAGAALIVVEIAVESEKDWVTPDPTPLSAVTLRAKVPEVPIAGVPDSVAVPSPLSTNVTPLGSAPLSVRAGGLGSPPDVVKVNVPAEPGTKVAVGALVMVGREPGVVSVAPMAHLDAPDGRLMPR